MRKLFIYPNKSIKKALKQLTMKGEKCLVVVNQDKELLGTLSDGDLRRAILNGKNINESINGIFNSTPTFIYKDQYTKQHVKDIFLEEHFDIIPVLDKSKRVVEILSWSSVFKSNSKEKRELLNVSVVIMAGGRGARMEPFTKILPKPLVPVQGKPIIEHIIQRFQNVGCHEFHLTVNYKSRILKAYFEELNPDYQVYFVEEKEPLGTAGSLSFFDGKFGAPFFVTNCDILIEADYAKLYEFHNKEKNDITLVASTKEYIIPYGTCELNGDGHLSHINEKPKYDFLINTGLYILNPDILNLIPENRFYHITHLIEDAKNEGKKVGVFPIDDDAWIDVGQWVEYRKAIEQL